MNLTQFPRRRYTHGPTPIEKLSRLSKLLGGPDIYIKRDDLLGLTGGGNKTRKLEFLVADALAQGADTLITFGAIQSNHCRLTAAAAAQEGLKCRLVLEEAIPNTYSPTNTGNNLLFHLLGVEKFIRPPADCDPDVELQKAADQARAEGRKPYIIGIGGSNPIGATGYAACAQETLAQLFDMGINLDAFITPSGSTGTHAGLIAGFWGLNSQIPVVGINVSRDRPAQEKKCYDLLCATTKRLGISQTPPRSTVECLDDYVGEGYTIPTEPMKEAVRLLAAAEGILLDPVYTGKAMAGLIDLVKKRRFQKGQNIMFLHTGGAPAIYYYSDLFLR